MEETNTNNSNNLGLTSETEITEENCLNLFSKNKASTSTNGAVRILKEQYKEFYSITKDLNDSRLYNKDNLLRKSILDRKATFNRNYSIANKYFLSLNNGSDNTNQINRLSILRQNDLADCVIRNNDSLLSYAYRFKNLLNPKLQVIKRNGKTVKYVMNDHIYNSNLQDLVKQKDKLSYTSLNGNNFSSSVYFNCMNPNLNSFSNNYNNTLNPNDVIDSLKAFVSANLFNGSGEELKKRFIFMDVVNKACSYGNNDIYDMDLLEAYNHNNIDKTIYDEVEMYTQKEIALQVAVYMLNPLYNFNSGNVAASIFFTALSIQAIKKLYSSDSDVCKETYKQFVKDYALCIKSIANNQKQFIIEELFGKYVHRFVNILRDDISLLIQAFITGSEDVNNLLYQYNTIYSGKDEAIIYSSLVELFTKIDSISWFDFGVFEVDIKEGNVALLTEFAASLLEAALLYKNALLNGNKVIHPTSIYDNRFFYGDGSTISKLKRPDFTCTLTKENTFKLDGDQKNKTDCDFAAVNIMISLANSIIICSENFLYKDEPLKTKSQLKYRNKDMLKVWTEYIWNHLNQMQIYTYEGITQSKINLDNEKNQYQYLGALDYLLQTKCWLSDSYYFWRSYKKMIDLLVDKNVKSFDQIFSKYCDCSGNTLVFSSFKFQLIASYVDNLDLDLLSGIYSYTTILGCLKYYLGSSTDGILSALSRILLKDVYIFDFGNIDLEVYRKSRYIEDEKINPFVLKNPLMQLVFRLFRHEEYERILSNCYLQWYKYIVMPYLEKNPQIKDRIVKTVGEIPVDIREASKRFLINGMCGQVFAYEPLCNLVIHNNIKSITVIAHITIMTKYLVNLFDIWERAPAMNRYRMFKFEDVKRNIFGKNIMYKLNTCSGTRRWANILETLWDSESGIGNSVDDIFLSSNGLPLYLFYQDGFAITLTHLYMVEDNIYSRYFQSTSVEITLDVIKTFFIEPIIINEILKQQPNTNIMDAINFVNNNMKFDGNNEKYLKLVDFINSMDIKFDILNIINQYSNVDVYLLAILVCNNNNWDVEQYQKYLKQKFYKLDYCLAIKNKIIDIFYGKDNKEEAKVNETVEVEEEDTIVDNNIRDTQKLIVMDESDNTISFNHKLYRKNANNKVSLIKNYVPPIIKLQSVEVDNEECKKFKESMVNLKKVLAFKHCNFIFETL